MQIYQLPEKTKTEFFFSNLWRKIKKRNNLWILILAIFLSSFFGFLAGGIAFYLCSENLNYFEKIALQKPLVEKETGEKVEKYIPETSQEEAIVEAVRMVSPAVVSIVISKDVPVIEEYFENPFEEFEEFFGPLPDFRIPRYRQKGTEKKEIGGGTGFIVSKDGLVLTNKHVVFDKEADYTVFTNEGKKYRAKVLAKDPVQDLAILKIEPEKKLSKEGEISFQSFPVAKLGNSDELEIGQTVIAIGNALGEFRNTVSVGVISGLGRRITASGGGFVETLEDVIQTDAAINKGNSGGPLLNLKGEVIGINTAMVMGAQSIGFAIPINKAKRDIQQIKKLGKIVYPFLGVRYILITEKIKEEKNLPVDYGALIVRGEGEPAILPGSAAEKAGLKEGDIILEVNNQKITQDNSLAKIITEYNPGDKISLKVLRKGKELNFEVILGERSE